MNAGDDETLTDALIHPVENARQCTRACASNKSRCTGLSCAGVLGLITVILLAKSFAALEPTEYGLLMNGYTGSVSTGPAYEGGLHFIFLNHYFIK
jgi:hypothetical protein